MIESKWLRATQLGKWIERLNDFRLSTSHIFTQKFKSPGFQKLKGWHSMEDPFKFNC